MQDYALLVLNNITRLQHQQQSQSGDATPSRGQSSFDPNNNWKDELNNNSHGSKCYLTHYDQKTFIILSFQLMVQKTALTLHRLQDHLYRQEWALLELSHRQF